MKIVETVVLLSRGAFSKSNAWSAIREALHAAIAQAEWPVGTGKFIIHPQSGKKSGEGNGVVPIKAKPMAALTPRSTVSCLWSNPSAGHMSGP